VVRELVGKTQTPLARIDDKVIVVAHELSPAETAHMAVDRVLGFATDIGSPTSHAAIVAKSLRIPAVVGLKTLTGRVKHGDMVLIDGQAGIVIVNPSPEAVREYEEKTRRLAEMRIALREYRGLAAETLDGHKIKLAANLEIMEEIEFYEECGAEGVGLYRTEYLYLDRDDLPNEEEHFEGYKKLAQATGANGAVIRTSISAAISSRAPFPSPTSSIRPWAACHPPVPAPARFVQSPVKGYIKGQRFRQGQDNVPHDLRVPGIPRRPAPAAGSRA